MSAAALGTILAERIRAEGPLPLPAFMAAALMHPRFGYYTTRDPLGGQGDFTTAPEISQMFGELIGVWCLLAWQSMGMPSPFVLAELGPGRGTLMADLLRAVASVPDFTAAADLWLVEASPTLRNRQRQRLDGVAVSWAERVEDLPPGPLLVVANEFFDALPIEQFECQGGLWHRRLVGLDSAGGFAFVRGPAVEPPFAPAPDGAIVETCPEGRRIAALLGARLARDGIAALVIDYGHARTAVGETLQAVKSHAFHPVLATPGQADLTAHVDFQALAEAAMPARAFGPVEQGSFLVRLGIHTRAGMLAQAAGPEMTADIAGQMRRLIDPTEMGTLFKVLALAHPAVALLPGLDP
ncbi:MAG: SAM-dependent methyltransferase [Magnetospirillum sp.]|nr:SAM-dependent methyltransferase [Magnetospirillum sp.]